MMNLVYNSQFSAVVYPENTQDVKKALLFARDHGLRLTVSSTGHDYIGNLSLATSLHWYEGISLNQIIRLST